jgi:thioredoxin reductase (NADPH)
VAKPFIIAIDDDDLVLSAVTRDLRRQYSESYSIVSVASGKEALATLEELLTRGDAAALILADQRMPEMTGVDVLEASLRLFPDAKRVLLTAYADTEAAIGAINRAQLDHYILKPWDPPEDRLYPILDDLLADWQASYRPPFRGIRVVADRWSREAHQLKEFLARNQVPYQAIDVEEGEEGRILLEAVGAAFYELPVVVLEDGSHLVRPSPSELAEKVGMRAHAELPSYDLAIVGGGPAGLASAVYGASEGLSTVLIESDAPGGQAGQSARIENYLGFPVGLSGADLARRAVTQARRFGAELLVPLSVSEVTRNDPFRILKLSDGSEISCKALVVATGVQYRLLPADGADRLAGAGLFYGASAVEANIYQGHEVAIIGAGNSAGQSAVYLSGFARKVTMLVKGPSLDEYMSRYLIDRITGIENIEVRYQVDARAIHGTDRVEGITIGGPADDETLPVSAVFVFIGQAPRTEWLGDVVQRDEQGFILTGNDCRVDTWPLTRARLPLETSVPGIFAAGDVRSGSIKRVASATGEGAMAVRFVHEHLASL